MFPVKRPVVHKVSPFLYHALFLKLEIKTSNKIIERIIGNPIAYTSFTVREVIEELYSQKLTKQINHDFLFIG